MTTSNFPLSNLQTISFLFADISNILAYIKECFQYNLEFYTSIFGLGNKNPLLPSYMLFKSKLNTITQEIVGDQVMFYFVKNIPYISYGNTTLQIATTGSTPSDPDFVKNITSNDGSLSITNNNNIIDLSVTSSPHPPDPSDPSIKTITSVDKSIKILKTSDSSVDIAVVSSPNIPNPKDLISADQNNAIIAGKDSKLFVKVVSSPPPAELVSADQNNAIIVGNDSKLYVKKSSANTVIDNLKFHNNVFLVDTSISKDEISANLFKSFDSAILNAQNAGRPITIMSYDKIVLQAGKTYTIPSDINLDFKNGAQSAEVSDQAILSFSADSFSKWNYFYNLSEVKVLLNSSFNTSIFNIHVDYLSNTRFIYSGLKLVSLNLKCTMIEVASMLFEGLETSTSNLNINTNFSIGDLNTMSIQDINKYSYKVDVEQ